MKREGSNYQFKNEYSKKVVAKYYQDGASVTLPMPNAKHINRFIKRNCALDLLNPKLELRWDAKEISESESIFYAIRTKLNIYPKDKSVLVFCVGDGVHPRTGALLSFTTMWTVISIDPGLRDKWQFPENAGIKRLRTARLKAEDVTKTTLEKIGINRDNFKTMIIAAPHSHAKLLKCLHLFGGRNGHVVSLPCCVPQELDQEPDYVYYDWACLSGERLIKIWKNVAISENV